MPSPCSQFRSISQFFHFFVSLMLFCAVPQDPSSPENTKITPLVKNMYNITSENVGSDSAGNTVSIGLALYLPENIDSIYLVITADGNTVFDSVINNYNRSSSQDTIWKVMTFETFGNKIATFTPFSPQLLSPVTATVIINPKSSVNGNNPPLLSVTGNTYVRPGETVSLNVIGQDSDAGQLLSIYSENGPENAVFTNNAFVWTAPADFIGTESVDFIAIDNGQPPMSDTERVVLTVSATPNPPVLQITGNRIVKPLETCSLSLTVSDADAGQVHVVTMSGNPEGSVIEGDSLFIWAVPAGTPDGNYSITFIVMDNGVPPLSGSNEITVTVSAEGYVNVAPQWDKDTLPVSLTEEQNYSLTLTGHCSDANGDQITYTLVSGNPEGDVVTDGVYSFNAPAGSHGSYLVHIVASDNQNANDTLVIRMEIPGSVVATAPVIQSTPADTTVTAGVDLQFTVTCTVTAVQMQWRKNGADIAGAVSATLALSSVTIADAGTYAVKVWNTIDSAVSSPFTLTILPNAASGVEASARSAFSIGVIWDATDGATGYTVLRSSGQGMFAPAGSVTETTFIDTPLTEGTTYSYKVIGQNSGGTSDTSEMVSATTWSGPSITTQPQDISVAVGAPVNLSVEASGDPRCTFQWMKDGTAIPGATTATFSINASSATDNGQYLVAVTNAVRSVNSDQVSVTVSPAVPTGLNAQATSATSVELSWNAAPGAESYIIEQSINGTTFTEAGTAATTGTTITSLTEGTAYTFRVTAVNSGAQSASGTTAQAITWSGPEITTQPTAQTLTVGDNLELNVVATGDPAVTYQWYRNDAPIATDTQATFSRSSVTANDAGRYYVVVTNSVRDVTSDEVMVTVQAKYTLATSTSPGSGGTIARSPDATEYIDGATVQLTATPASGYRFDSWSGDATGSTAQTSVTMNGDKSVTANFVQQFTLTVSTSTGGTVSPSGATTVDAGAATGISATAGSGYEFAGWTVTAGTAIIASSSSSNTTVQLTSGNATVQASWQQVLVTVTYNRGFDAAEATENGPSITTENVQEGGTIGQVPTGVKNGYVFDGWWTGQNGTGQEFISYSIVNQGITVYAKWVIEDADQNVYTEVKIGDQVWMVENLKNTNGLSSWPFATDWTNTTGPSYAWYLDNPANNQYGAYYNEAAVFSGNLAPDGWHIPSQQDWEDLINYAKQNYTNWASALTYGEWDLPGGPEIRTNETGLTLIAAGNSHESADATNTLTYGGYYWSSTPGITLVDAWPMGGMDVGNYNSEGFAFSIRLMRDY